MNKMTMILLVLSSLLALSASLKIGVSVKGKLSCGTGEHYPSRMLLALLLGGDEEYRLAFQFTNDYGEFLFNGTFVPTGTWKTYDPKLWPVVVNVPVANYKYKSRCKASLHISCSNSKEMNVEVPTEYLTVDADAGPTRGRFRDVKRLKPVDHEVFMAATGSDIFDARALDLSQHCYTGYHMWCNSKLNEGWIFKGNKFYHYTNVTSCRSFESGPINNEVLESTSDDPYPEIIKIEKRHHGIWD